MNSTYVSAINFMKQREIMNKVVDLFNEEETIVDIMDLCDRYVPTAVKEYVYHANTRLHSAATVDTAGAAEPAAGASSTIPLTAGSVKPTVGSMMITAGRFRSVVTAVSGNNITVKPLSASVDAHEALVSGDKVTFFSNAYAEGTGANIGYTWPVLQYENNIQIIHDETEGVQPGETDPTGSVAVTDTQHDIAFDSLSDAFKVAFNSVDAIPGGDPDDPAADPHADTTDARNAIGYAYNAAELFTVNTIVNYIEGKLAAA